MNIVFNTTITVDGETRKVPCTRYATDLTLTEPIHSPTFRRADMFTGVVGYLDDFFGSTMWSSQSFCIPKTFSQDYPTMYAGLSKIFPSIVLPEYQYDPLDGNFDVDVNGLPSTLLYSFGDLGLVGPFTGSNNFNTPLYLGYTGGTVSGEHVTKMIIRSIIWPISYVPGGKVKLPPIDFTDGTGKLNFTLLTIQLEEHGNSLDKSDVTISPQTITITKTLYDAIQGTTVNPFIEDPYTPGGSSHGGGGGGSFNGSSVPINHPGLPSLQASDTGFLSLYSPSISQVQAMANYMWSDGFSLDDFKKLFADPMQAILSFHAVPVPVSKSAIRSVKLGNIDTGVHMPPVSNQWVTVDCGSLTLPEFWGAYLDYNPYTRLQLYLPYIGVVTVSADDVIGKALSLHYNVDVLSGACVATLMCAGTVLYNWQGAVAMQIPFTTLTYGNLLGSILSVAGSGLGLAASAIASGGVSSGAAIGVAGAAGAAAVNSQKENIGHGGGVSGTAGFMGIQTPYFILSRPSLCLPENQNDFIGYPSFTTVKLSSLSGFTRIHEIHLEYIAATKDELTELEGLLKEGVLF